EEDYVEHLFVATTHSYILLFSNQGKVYWLKVHEVPQLGRAAKGKAIANFLTLEGAEKITAFLPVRQFEVGRYLVMATKQGVVKKTELMAYSNPRSGGIIAVNLDEGDELIAVRLTRGDDELFLATRQGNAIRFSEEDVRAVGRQARGVAGIELAEGDEVVAAEVVASGSTVLTVTERGYGKRTELEEYRLQGRGGKGIINVNVTERNGPVVGVMQVRDEDSLMMISQTGQVTRLRVGEVRIIGRNTQGVRLQQLEESDRVAAVTRLAEDEEPNGGAAEAPGSGSATAGDEG
ncbi:MAG TPA: DNA gyrase C-terminal beta-propeller domain-containing protein, partial [Candidatus Sulfotelmatobacter sp.]|nr:DNA gyrase C-terminal beta-propeller domain-containing protein [Candidatus Sulfotelmatobacter sp.]